MKIGACLNPYSNGILSDYCYDKINTIKVNVLILILMEYSLTHHTQLEAVRAAS